MFEKYIISSHAISRYAERIGYNKKDIVRRIKSDLYFTKVKKIVNLGEFRHVFTYNSKEFIFEKKGPNWILKTVIKRNRERNIQAIEKLESLLI